MSKRGLSAEEKADRAVAFFHETKSYFTMKDLQKLLAKEKAIVAQSIEEVVKSCVDQGRARSEKIGTVNLYWSFPSQAAADARSTLSKAEKEHDGVGLRQEAVEAALVQARVGRQETDDRAQALAGLALKEREVDRLKAEILGSNDAGTHREKRRRIAIYKAGALKQTEDLTVLEKACCARSGAEKAAFRAMFELPEDYDELE